jgi:hypothetical protein
MTTTLVLTRKPDNVFQSPLFSDQSGRFGILIVLQGGVVTNVRVAPPSKALGAIAINTGILDITTSGGGADGVEEVKRYTTIERMGGYVQLKPQSYNGTVYKQGPYGISYEPNNPVVARLKATGGRCFRVSGGITEKERAILIHEAPHVGFLTGCIGPRQLNDNQTGLCTSAHAAMEEMFALRPAPSALFVLDF